MVKQLKNRYNDPTINKRFVVGIDRAKMRLYDCEQSAQDDSLTADRKKSMIMRNQKPKKSFEGFKFSELYLLMTRAKEFARRHERDAVTSDASTNGR